MSSSRTCSNCDKSSFVRDDVSGELFCSTCGAIQQFDQFEAQIGGINGPQGTFIHIGTAGSGSVYTYEQRKLFSAQNSIDELTSRLGLASKSVDIRNMISSLTEGEFGQGEWFHVLIGACSYVVMRKDDRPLPMAEIASAVGCDVYELGRMILRVVDFLGLKRPDFPEFDIVHSLERTLKNSPCFAAVERSMVETMRKQGIFLIQCAVKWFLSTGRRPIPLVVAVLVFVAELNQVEVRMDDLAKEVHAMVSTCRTRYKELLETLVKVAQVLPWGKDITTKNIVYNAPFVIQYMEKKSMSKPTEKRGNVDLPVVDLADVVAECLRRDDEYEYGNDGVSSRNDSRYFSFESNADRPGVKDVDRLQISHECLSMLYEKFLNENRRAKSSRRSGNAQKRKRLVLDLQDCMEWWNGKSELSKKLLLKHLLEKDVGMDTMPPSFVAGQLKCKMRREKIDAAKVRIQKIMHPLDADLGDTANPGLSDGTHPGRRKKKRRGMVVDDIDWEDLIIETLILHQVKEQEIEKGHYNTLLDLHVFKSGIV
ncbi:plant-specific TFIIB-related protein PTF2-like [Gastrolobium bilobum]|uniref:plant-specific TFIIB-related protein PTF2-like n=1 Tax=Gastrolobium bilobum TaxID=150636 RepID=UPI002AAF83ED|nr:plant-specific TFIIB-related protein PTF2-like [Gastrolobium bilobum]